MKAQKEKRPALEDVLKTALADDLPADVAAGMKGRLERFRSKTMAARTMPKGRAWLLPRAAWAALAVLLLVAGIILQGARVPSPLADRISSFKTAAASLEPLRR